jgi:hypothetical protein
MEKRYRWERFTEDARVRQFKWEFLRRNEDYQLEYATFANRFPEWISKYGTVRDAPDPSEPDSVSFYEDQISPAVSLISERWGITEPVDPRVSDSSWLVRFFQPAKDEKNGPPVGPAVPYKQEDCVWDYFTQSLGAAPHTREGLRFVNVQLDITQPLQTLFDHLEIHIEIARSRYRVHIGELPEHRKAPRARLGEYESYLKVWDLRCRNLTFERIAEQLVPGQMENPDSRSAAVKRMRSHFLRAQKLIDGEYRQIEG